MGRTLMLVAVALFAGCASTPRTQAKRTGLEQRAAAAQQAILSKAPSARSLIAQAAGYIVCPEVKEGGFIVGGAGAQCVIYEQGRQAGFATLTRASVGAEVGGQKYDELIVVRDRYMLDQIRSGDIGFGAEASATVLRTGVASVAPFGRNGVSVIVDPIGGAMVNLSVAGQRIKQTM